MISIAFSPSGMWLLNFLLSSFFCDTWSDMWHNVICLAIVTILQCKHSLQATWYSPDNFSFYLSRNYSFIYTWLVENFSWIPTHIITWSEYDATNHPKWKVCFDQDAAMQLCTCTYSVHVCMYIHFMHFALKLTALKVAFLSIRSSVLPLEINTWI